MITVDNCRFERVRPGDFLFTSDSTAQFSPLARCDGKKHEVFITMPRNRSCGYCGRGQKDGAELCAGCGAPLQGG